MLLTPTMNLKPYNILDSMKPDQNVGNLGILDGANNFIDTFIRQFTEKEPVHSFSRGGDSLQWIQLLQALDHDHQAPPGWPLLSPKVQMQKCDKYAREFCSSINYRRHVRVHRRSLNIDKDFPKNRDLLAVFWDKLSTDKAKEIASFNNIALEGVSGSSILEMLSSLICTPGFTLLPQVYVKAGLALLDVVQARSWRFPISSEELFSIFDNASEKTFLCAGTAISMQKFVFDGEIGKIGFEMKNIVACTCFLLEQKLVKAWDADKDAEALRCQKLLMEEEETAQKRQAELFEKRRLKKLRQKEQQKAKEQIDREEAAFGDNSSEKFDREEADFVEHIEADYGENFSDSLIGLPSVEISSSQAVSNLHMYAQEELSESVPLQLVVVDTSGELDSSCLLRLNDLHLDTAPSNVDSNNFRNVDHPLRKRNVFRQPRQTSSSSQHSVSNEFHFSAFPKSGPVHRQVVHKDQKSTVIIGHKIWTPKIMHQNKAGDVNVEVLGASNHLNEQESRDQPDLNVNHEGQCRGAMLDSPIDQCAADKQLFPNKKLKKKHANPDSGQVGTNRSVKLWRPVNKHEVAVKDCESERERDPTHVINIRATDEASTKEICSPVSTDVNSSIIDSSAVMEDQADPRRLRLFCSNSAEAFLTRRWKEAICADQGSKPPNHSDHPDDTIVSAPVNPNILCSSENRMSGFGSLEAAKEFTKARAKTKVARSGRLNHVPKQRSLN